MLNAKYNGFDSFEFSYENNGTTYTAVGRYDNHAQGSIVAAPSGKDSNMISDQINSLGQDQFIDLIRSTKANSEQQR